MSIKLALLKSGEEVIADISEFRQEETDILVSYLFRKPYCIKIKTSEVLVEDKSKEKHALEQPYHLYFLMLYLLMA